MTTAAINTEHRLAALPARRPGDEAAEEAVRLMGRGNMAGTPPMADLMQFNVK